MSCPESVLPLMFRYIQDISDLARRILLLNDLESLQKRHSYIDIKPRPPGAYWQSLDTVLHFESCFLSGDDGSLLSWSDKAMSNHLGDSRSVNKVKE